MLINSLLCIDIQNIYMFLDHLVEFMETSISADMRVAKSTELMKMV
jgi:hypothetical protein